MLELDQLRDWMKDLESDRVERTRSTQGTDKFCEAICAFSNDFPNHQTAGYLLIGVDDQGRPTGLKATDELLRNLGGIRSSGNILPPPAMSVEKHTLPEAQADIVLIKVLPSDMPPVRYKGRVWIRIGPRRAVASETEERILAERRTAAAKTFDCRACLGADLSDLDEQRFRMDFLRAALPEDVVAENRRNLRDQLASFRFYDLRRDSPTYAGLLVFGKEPLAWIPGAYIQFLRIDGTELTDPLQTEKTFAGDLLTALQELNDFVPVQIQSRSERSDSFREIPVADYPIIAIRELLMNAMMHRWYEESTSPIRFHWFSDRIEIQSPGGLYGEVTPENFPNVTSYRNPVIAESMKILGYVNRFGRGVLRAQEALRRNGNPEAAFDFQQTYVLATVWRRP